MTTTMTTPNPMSSPSKGARILAAACALAAVFIGVGFCFHTSFDPVVMGKYSGGYFLGLCVWFVVIVPAVYGLARMLFSTQIIDLPSGNRVEVTPLRKFAFFFAVFVLVFAPIGRSLRERMQERNGVVFHPFLQTMYRPGHEGLHINRWGFRGGEIDKEKGDGVFRIFVFGGSTVACHFAEFEDTHCRVLERNLRSRYPGVDIEVQNVGTPWHGSEHSAIKLLFNVQDFSPDLVIIYHAMADLFRGFEHATYTEGPYRDDYAHFLGPVSTLVRSGRFNPSGLPLSAVFGYWCSDFRFEKVRVLGPYGDGINGRMAVFCPKAERVGVESWRSLATFERNMGDFVDAAKKLGMEVLVASQPHLYRDDLSGLEREVLFAPIVCTEDGKRPDIPSMKRGMDTFNQTAARVAAQRGVRFLDLEQRIPKNLEYFYDDVHYTVLGNAAVAEAFTETIVDWELIAQDAAEQGLPHPN